MELKDARKRIDELDADIVKLLAERFEISKKIGEEKKRLSLPLTNAQREQEILDNATKSVDIALESCIIDVYKAIFRASKSLQDVHD